MILAPDRRPWWAAVLLLLLAAILPSSVRAQTLVASFSGQVEYAEAGSELWKGVSTNTVLTAGARVKTGPDGHAVLQLSDRSVIRVDRSSLIEIKGGPEAEKKGFFLRLGRIFFLNREKPSDVEFDTPLITGAIRGTEFVLTVTPVELFALALLDGNVLLTHGQTQLNLTSGEQASMGPSGDLHKAPLILAQNKVQWALYYPLVLNPGDLPSIPEDLTPSISAYRVGALRTAAHTLTADAPPEYGAAVRLSIGDFEGAEQVISPVHTRAADALRELMDAVQFREMPRTNPCSTSTEWLARSYYLQSRADLSGALAAAERAAAAAPRFGPALVRYAELLFASGRRQPAAAALETGLDLSPELASAYSLKGFIELENEDLSAAAAAFTQAIALDDRMGEPWLGKALLLEHAGNYAEGRRALQIAAALEPQRSVIRSYLGKGWSAANDPVRADKELTLAKKLDPEDPTPWFYSGLHLYQENRFNEAIDEIEHAWDLNDNRSLFRSRLLLNRDRSVRSADLAAVFDAVGMNEVSERTSARAVTEDYANFSGHLFRARSLQRLESADGINLRYESARQSELLVANLLAPPGAGNLSQNLSQEEHLRFFYQRPFGLSSLTEYRSNGDWLQSSSLFGQIGRFGYAVDSQYIAGKGEFPNQESEDTQFSVQVKEQVTPDDGLYLQLGWRSRTSGDLAQYYDPLQIDRSLKVKEKQEPTLYAGWHHEWSPGNHTLLLAARLNDELNIEDFSRPLLFVQRDFLGRVTDVDYERARFDLKSRSEFTLYNVEVQQLLEREKFSLIGGVRLQSGTFDTQATLSGPVPPPLSNQQLSPDLERLSAYAYYLWRPLPSLRFTVGLSYDKLRYPENIDLAPFTEGERDRDLVSPKVGVIYSPFDRTYIRAAYTRSLGGSSFDNSVRLEPSQVSGFNQTFRSLAPESAAGLIPGAEFDTWQLGVDQSFRTRTYMGVTAELLRSEGDRQVGAVANSVPVPVPDTPIQLHQNLRFEERSLTAYVNQLIAREWSLGARYRLSDAQLSGNFPDIPSAAFGAAALAQDQKATLQEADLFLRYNHPSGFFGEWDSSWFAQSNRGYSPDRPGDDFWQHNIYAGYRFRRHYAELRIGIENLTARDYKLNPLNYYLDLPRDRTFVARLKLNF